MKEIVKKTFWAFWVTVLWIGSVFAVETTMIVKLQQDIKTSVKKLGQMQKEHEKRIADLNRQMEQVIQELHSTNDPEKKDYLAKRYFHLRAEQLAAEAESYAKMHDVLVDTIFKMEKLQRLMGRDEGLSPLSEEDKKVVSNVMVGVRNLFYKIQALEPNNPRLVRISHTIGMLDRRFQRFFSPRRHISLQEQIDYLSDLAAFMQATLSFMEEERNYLLQNIYFLVQIDLRRYINDLKPSYHEINEEYSRHQENDAEVLDSISANSPEVAYRPVNLDNVGQY